MQRARRQFQKKAAAAIRTSATSSCCTYASSRAAPKRAASKNRQSNRGQRQGHDQGCGPAGWAQRHDSPSPSPSPHTHTPENTAHPRKPVVSMRRRRRNISWCRAAALAACSRPGSPLRHVSVHLVPAVERASWASRLRGALAWHAPTAREMAAQQRGVGRGEQREEGLGGGAAALMVGPLDTSATGTAE